MIVSIHYGNLLYRISWPKADSSCHACSDCSILFINVCFTTTSIRWGSWVLRRVLRCGGAVCVGGVSVCVCVCVGGVSVCVCMCVGVGVGGCDRC